MSPPMFSPAFVCLYNTDVNCLICSQLNQRSDSLQSVYPQIQIVRQGV